ncbi:DUF899 family protein [Paraburkholderia phenazinium]|jgi:predicted dithiol-disulfide oxidoreductase (DUF899 family)|uniref:Predicted dithiol-disulfide oxidoreductase, DUF899 family n=1 Tax=Paraburkholderia phenazinium TaxID=60549 RepID=A0A1N6IT44_9BURK|nr:DUF899 family protein [Paraburkholderia phenazinium]SIO35210.1 Predicted dithiol-disulfide oxidoreductase, DUF899 family [Paraburkholderia phenazinium]
MTDTDRIAQQPQALQPATLLAQSPRRFPGESTQYREARNALLAEEIELRRHIERVAAQRRALPPGGAVPQDYRFEGEHGPVTLTEMFGAHDTLVTYNWMFGPRTARSCPMCAATLSSLDGEMADILQRVAFAVIARSPIERLLAFKKERGWRHLRVYSSGGNSFNRDYANEDPDGEDTAEFNVFTRSGGVLRHFWGGEMGPQTADPGQDPRGAPDIMPVWQVLDMTPGGRGTNWYPKLEYGTSPAAPGDPAGSCHCDSHT